MKKNIYLNAKALIKSEAKQLKSQNTDKGYIRYELNNLADDMIKQFNWYAMKGTISERQAKLYAFWLSSFTADQHP